MRAGLSLTAALSRRLALQAFAVLALVGCGVYGAAGLMLAQRQQALLEEKQVLVRHLLGKADGELALSHALQDVLTGHEELGLRLRWPDGRETRAGRGEPLAAGRHVDFRLARDGLPTLQVRLMLDRSRDQALLQRMALVLGAAALAGALLMSTGSHLLVRRAMRPLQGLLQQIGRLSPQRLDERLDGAGQPQELQPLIAQFNQLLGRLEQAYRQLEAFNANVAHELNTPLALLASSCQLGLQRARSEGELREILAANLEDLDRLAGIVRDMLFLARADQGRRADAGQVVSLAALAHEVLDFHEAALQEAGLQAEVAGEASLAVDAGLMRRALSNLVGNASRHAQPGSRLCVRIRALKPAGIELAVENQGDAIAPEALARMFERFYRGDGSEVTETRHGLGLAIVDAIARMHGGQTFARSEAGRNCIGLLLPASGRSGSAQLRS